MPDHQEFVIHIDRQEVKVTATSLTGAQIRALHKPPIGPDRDLFLKVSGPTDDELIKDDQSVALKEGMHFYSAPHTITPG
jgi:hypothetical protein